MKNYRLYNNNVEIIQNDGRSFILYFNENSGKVYYRYKKGTLTGIKHPGIFLGVDGNGQGYFLHNHYHYGKAHIVSEQSFRQGMDIYLYKEKCSNEPLKVIAIGLDQVLRGERYHAISYNCQTFANTACDNQRKSEDVDKWVGAGIAAALLIIGGALFGSKR